MRQLMIAAAGIALLASAPAKADVNYGPKQNGNQCWKSSVGNEREGRFGYWSTCPKPASTAIAPVASRPAKR